LNLGEREIMDINQSCHRREFMAFAGGFAALSMVGSPRNLQGVSSKPFRRVVTGVNPAGQSTIVSDGQVPDAACFSSPGQATGCDLWLEKTVPVDLDDQSDPMADYSLQSWPPPGGVIVRTLTWEPGYSYPMHRSDTVDFIFVISGQLELVLEDGSTVLAPGDSVVQRGTNHAWRVVGDEPCSFVAVLLSAVS
jgi:mannose-6-phosphate isomerase-like protein (cupin superfamily)